MPFLAAGPDITPIQNLIITWTLACVGVGCCALCPPDWHAARMAMQPQATNARSYRFERLGPGLGYDSS